MNEASDSYADSTEAPAEPVEDYNPYQPPEAMVADLDAVDLEELPLAARRTRLAARFIDGFLFALLFLLAAFLAGFFEGSDNAEAMASTIGLILALALFVIQVVYLVMHSQTLGKKAMGIKIVRNDGSRASGPRLVVLRELVYLFGGFIPILGPIFSLVNPLFIVGVEQRCLHDYIADTKVVIA